MHVTLSLSVQRRINTLDTVSVISVLMALVFVFSPLITALFLFGCLFCQALVFRAYFKYVKDHRLITKSILLIIGNFGVIILLLYHNKLL